MGKKDEAQLPAVIVPDTQALMLKALEHDNADTLRQLVELQQSVSREEARKAWHAAVSAFQNECPEIPKTKQGRFGKYAPLGGTLNIVRPFLSRHGLSVTWATRHVEGSPFPWKYCRLAHALGHVEESPCPIIVDERAGQDRDGRETLNEMQKYAIADSYAERYSFEAVTGLAPAEADSDGEAPQSPQKPRRRSEASRPAARQDGPPPPGDHAAPPSKGTTQKPASNGNPAIVQVVSTEEFSGTSARGPWKKVVAACSDDNEYGTFSESFATILQAAEGEDDEWLSIKWKDGKHGRDVVDVDMVEAPA